MNAKTNVCVHVYVYVCVCVCACVTLRTEDTVHPRPQEAFGLYIVAVTGRVFKSQRGEWASSQPPLDSLLPTPHTSPPPSPPLQPALLLPSATPPVKGSHLSQPTGCPFLHPSLPTQLHLERFKEDLWGFCDWLPARGSSGSSPCRFSASRRTLILVYNIDSIHRLFLNLLLDIPQD